MELNRNLWNILNCFSRPELTRTLQMIIFLHIHKPPTRLETASKPKFTFKIIQIIFSSQLAPPKWITILTHSNSIPERSGEEFDRTIPRENAYLVTSCCWPNQLTLTFKLGCNMRAHSWSQAKQKLIIYGRK